MNVIRLAELRDAPLSVDEVLAAVADAGAGGTAMFVGTVRDEDHRRAVTGLGYTAHPQAVDRLRVVLEKVVAEYDVRAIAAVHRVGDLAVGDLAVVVAAASPHRDQAFAACRTLIDDLKAEVPIWKHQVFADGGDEWVGVG
jgi:molybdopterin synthase catalytic subunit